MTAQRLSMGRFLANLIISTVVGILAAIAIFRLIYDMNNLNGYYAVRNLAVRTPGFEILLACWLAYVGHLFLLRSHDEQRLLTQARKYFGLCAAVTCAIALLIDLHHLVPSIIPLIVGAWLLARIITFRKVQLGRDTLRYFAVFMTPKTAEASPKLASESSGSAASDKERVTGMSPIRIVGIITTALGGVGLLLSIMLGASYDQKVFILRESQRRAQSDVAALLLITGAAFVIGIIMIFVGRTRRK